MPGRKLRRTHWPELPVCYLPDLDTVANPDAITDPDSVAGSHAGANSNADTRANADTDSIPEAASSRLHTGGEAVPGWKLRQSHGPQLRVRRVSVAVAGPTPAVARLQRAR